MNTAADNEFIAARQFWQVPLNLVYPFGINLFKGHNNGKLSRLQWFSAGCCQSIFALCACSMVYYVLTVERKTPIENVEMILYFGFAANGVAKFFTVFIGRHKLAIVVSRMEAKFPKTAAQQQAYNTAAFYKTIRNYNWCLTLFTYLTGSLFNFFPLIQSIRDYYGTAGKFTFRFPYKLAYPFDVKQPLNYAFAYAFECVGAYIATSYCLGADTILLTSVLLINMNFTYLAKAIVDYRPTDNDNEDVDKLKEFLLHQNEILCNCSDIDDIFSLSILINYFLSGCLTCLIGFQMVAGDDFLSLVKFIGFLIDTLILVLVISLFGNKMIILSIGISDAFYENRWYMAGRKYQRMLPLIVACSQRPAYLTACKFFIVSIQTFKTLMTTSYQFFTLIKAQYDEK